MTQAAAVASPDLVKRRGGAIYCRRKTPPVMRPACRRVAALSRNCSLTRQVSACRLGVLARVRCRPFAYVPRLAAYVYPVALQCEPKRVTVAVLQQPSA